MHELARTNAQLVWGLESTGVLRSSAIRSALLAVDRRDFVLPEYQDDAYVDHALPIIGGQTISQPYTVVFMLELLGAQVGETVYDVGFGSGWQTALLAHMVGTNGHVYATEIVPAVCAFGKTNIAQYPEFARRVTLTCADAAQSDKNTLPKIDRIIVAADIEAIPAWWRKRLRIGGTLVYPQRGTIHCEKNTTRTHYTTQRFPGFVFVPFVETLSPVQAKLRKH